MSDNDMEDTMSYDPRSPRDRMVLANALMVLFQDAVFTEVSEPGCNERVFSRTVPDTDGKIRVMVYSTIEGTSCREVGQDAIRVCAVYHSNDGEDRGIASAEARVNRVGEITAICDRVLARMRECWKATKTAEKCHCGAPKFRSKKNNLVCADFCWKTDADRLRDRQRMQGAPSRRSWSRPRRAAFSPTTQYRTMPASWKNAPLAKQVAFMMADGDTSGFDWDQWADQMKEGC